MGNMQYQQTGKTHCFNDAAIDESYQNYLIDYLLDGATFLENYPSLCLEPAGNNQAIVYIYLPESGRISIIIRCLGCMD